MEHRLTLSAEAGSGAVVVAEDREGRRVWVRYYEDSKAQRTALERHGRLLKGLHGHVPVPDVVGLETTARRFGRPALLMSHTGEALDRVVPSLTVSERFVILSELVEALATLAHLQLAQLGWPARSPAETAAAIEDTFARDARDYRAHLPVEEPARELILRGAETLARVKARPGRVCLCHHDLTMSNLTVREGHLSGIIDWEYASPDAPEADLASGLLGLLVTLPLPKPERLELVVRFLALYWSRLGEEFAPDWRLALCFALDSLLDWLIGGKNAPPDELAWATSLVLRWLSNCDSPGMGGRP